jgi:CheY-like chemotaxis protein
MELEASTTQERRALAAKEEETVTQMKKTLEQDFSERLHSELDKIKQSAQHQQQQTRIELEESVRLSLQKDYEARLAKERGSIEERYKDLHSQVEISFKKQQQAVADESKRQVEEQLAVQRKAEAQKFEEQKAVLQKTLEQDFQKKLDLALANERTKNEMAAQQAVAKARAEFQNERNALLEQEQGRLESLRKSLKDQMAAEYRGEIEKISETAARSYEHRLDLLGIEIPKTKEQKTKIYESRVRQAWSEGPLTMEKAQQLMELQEILELGFEEHSELEAAVRLQLYADAIQSAIRGGKLKPNDTKALDELKLRFEITTDEATNVEPLILSAFQRAAVKARIMVADDDEALLAIIVDRLQEQGYSVIGISSLAEAMKQVETTSVDLILSDIQFKGEKGDGFTFFKFVQQKPHLRKTPFILMSSLDEGLFIRTGVQLGVDDYLTKPLDLDLLVAVIEGKLKKYRSMAE